jgi:outer membrane immunogenic protein
MEAAMKTRLAATLAVAVFSVSARADDRPRSTDYVTPRWSGFYIGADAGASWNSVQVDYTQAPGFATGYADPLSAGGFIRSHDLNDAPFIGGGHIGYNYQSGPLLVGVETDLKWRDNAKRSSSETFATFQDVLTLTAGEEWVG